jgi:hypothetical protein
MDKRVDLYPDYSRPFWPSGAPNADCLRAAQEFLWLEQWAGFLFSESGTLRPASAKLKRITARDTNKNAELVPLVRFELSPARVNNPICA